MDQTYHFELLCQKKGSTEQEIRTQKGWVGVTDNSDDIYETMTLSSHQMLRSECVMVIKALHIPRNGELFSKEEQ